MINVVFDMDGVLFDTQKIYCRAWEIAAEVLGIPDISEPLIKCIGMNRNDQEKLLNSYYDDSFPFEDFYREKNIAFDRILAQGVPVKPGTRELLKFLRDKGARVALASSTRMSLISENLKNTGLTDYFDRIISGDSVTHSKPAPEIYTKACGILDVAPAETYAVEDSYNGIRSAAAAGMKVIMVPDMQPPTDEIDALVYKRFDSLFGFMEYLDKDGI